MHLHKRRFVQWIRRRLFTVSQFHVQNSLSAMEISFPFASVSQKKTYSFAFAEPIQSVAPRLEVTEKLKLASAQLHHTTNLFCPVQSYPTPSHR